MRGDVLAAWGPRAPSLSVCYPSVIMLVVVLMVAESQKVTWGWGGLMETYSVIWAPFNQPFWWGFHFRLPVSKSSHVWNNKLLGAIYMSQWVEPSPPFGWLMAAFCPTNLSVWKIPQVEGLMVIYFSFTYRNAHWRKWWSPMGPATAGRWSPPEKWHTLEWVSGLPPRWRFPCGRSERPLQRKRIGDSQSWHGPRPSWAEAGV